MYDQRASCTFTRTNEGEHNAHGEIGLVKDQKKTRRQPQPTCAYRHESAPWREHKWQGMPEIPTSSNLALAGIQGEACAPVETCARPAKSWSR
eukprot:scaffold117026_cov33-Tisochrysis_lutea.AAC.6